MSELGKRLGVGANAEVYEYGEGKVIKLFFNRELAGGIHNELKNTMAVWKLGLPVPRPYEIVEMDDRPGLVMEQIKGGPLVARMFGEHHLDQMRLLARVLHQIQSAPGDAVSASGLRPIKGYLAWQAYNQTELTWVERRLVVHALADLPDGNCVCHGDFHMLNVMMNGETPVVIDWQGANTGDRCYDVMQLFLLLRYAVIPAGMLPQEAINGFYATREAMERTFMEEYHALMGVTQEEIEAWFLPCAASRLSTSVLPEEHDAVLAELQRRLAGVSAAVRQG